MLILTRRVGETLMIDDGEKVITATVMGVKGNQVRIGIEAPRDVIIDREEIFDRKQLEKKASQPEHKPRPCVDCGEQFAPPPYPSMENAKCCAQCATCA